MAPSKQSESQKRMKLLELLFKSGYKDEKALLDFDLEQASTVAGIKMEHLAMMKGLKQAIKEHKIITYLSDEK